MVAVAQHADDGVDAEYGGGNNQQQAAGGENVGFGFAHGVGYLGGEGGHRLRAGNGQGGAQQGDFA